MQGELFVLYSDGKKDITIIKSEGVKLTHKAVRGSKFLTNYYHGNGFVRVGNQFWISGGFNPTISAHNFIHDIFTTADVSH